MFRCDGQMSGFSGGNQSWQGCVARPVSPHILKRAAVSLLGPTVRHKLLQCSGTGKAWCQSHSRKHSFLASLPEAPLHQDYRSVATVLLMHFSLLFLGRPMQKFRIITVITVPLGNIIEAPKLWFFVFEMQRGTLARTAPGTLLHLASN